MRIVVAVAILAYDADTILKRTLGCCLFRLPHDRGQRQPKFKRTVTTFTKSKVIVLGPTISCLLSGSAPNEEVLVPDQC